jgi:hypothetical protein
MVAAIRGDSPVSGGQPEVDFASDQSRRPATRRRVILRPSFKLGRTGWSGLTCAGVMIQRDRHLRFRWHALGTDRCRALNRPGAPTGPRAEGPPLQPKPSHRSIWRCCEKYCRLVQPCASRSDAKLGCSGAEEKGLGSSGRRIRLVVAALRPTAPPGLTKAVAHECLT